MGISTRVVHILCYFHFVKVALKCRNKHSSTQARSLKIHIPLILSYTVRVKKKYLSC